MSQKNNIVNKLRSSGLRPTKQRVKIAEFLFDRTKTFHFTVENLNKNLNINKKSVIENISLATIYNTVHAFKKAGHLKTILIKEGVNYFDTNTSAHHHFYDEEINQLIDINFNEVEVAKLPRTPKGKKIKNVEVIISLKKN
tara:strand:- start:68 stop:490 length:423 start_codon:yes stop_codon:yes gene_type:complete